MTSREGLPVVPGWPSLGTILPLTTLPSTVSFVKYSPVVFGQPYDFMGRRGFLGKAAAWPMRAPGRWKPGDPGAPRRAVGEANLDTLRASDGRGKASGSGPGSAILAPDREIHPPMMPDSMVTPASPGIDGRHVHWPQRPERALIPRSPPAGSSGAGG